MTDKVILVGSGFVAPHHLAGWTALRDVEVIAIVSLHPEAARELAALFDIKYVHGSLEEALAAHAPDVVDICSPVACHVAHARAAIAAGADVICQKPLAPTLQEAVALADTVRRSGRRLMVHENFRFRPWYRLVKRLLDSGVIGTPSYLRSDCRFAGTIRSAANPDLPWSLARQPYFAEIDPFLLLESVVHQIDVTRFLLGEAERVYARVRRLSDAVMGEDMVSMILSLPHAEAVIERSYASKGHADPPRLSEDLLIEGTEGAIRVDGTGRVHVVEDRPSGRRSYEPDLCRNGAYAASYAAAIAHFHRCLRSGEPFETDIEDNLRTLDVVFAAYRSAHTGEAVALPTIDRNDQVTA